MPPKFDPQTLQMEYKLPTLVENDGQLIDYYNYLKLIGDKMGSVTEEDLKVFYHLMSMPQKFSRESLNKIFGLINQLASAERFLKIEDARECLLMIETYREEMGM